MSFIGVTLTLAPSRLKDLLLFFKFDFQKVSFDSQNQKENMIHDTIFKGLCESKFYSRNFSDPSISGTQLYCLRQGYFLSGLPIESLFPGGELKSHWACYLP